MSSSHRCSRVALALAAVAVPLLVAVPAGASGCAVHLSASANQVTPGVPVVLQATSTCDVGPTANYLEIYDQSGPRVASCSTGTTCSGAVTQLAETTRTYVAVIAGFSTTYPPSGVVATSNQVQARWAFVTPGTTVSGAVAFAGETVLPRFPCPPPPPFGTGPCTATLSAAWDGHLAGTFGLDAFDVSWRTDPTGLTATFDYAEWKCVGTETLLGSAVGTGTAVAVRPDVAGWWQVPGEPFTRSVLRVSARFDFSWIRTGEAAVVSYGTLDIDVEVDGLGQRRIATGGRTGTAALAITGTDQLAVPSCAQPMTNAHAQLAGTTPVVGT